LLPSRGHLETFLRTMRLAGIKKIELREDGTYDVQMSVSGML
jgi:hypothetical protein